MLLEAGGVAPVIQEGLREQGICAFHPRVGLYQSHAPRALKNLSAKCP
jgi:hypothetical protein